MLRHLPYLRKDTPPVLKAVAAILLWLPAVFALLAPAPARAAGPGGDAEAWQSLWNGTNLAGWTTWLRKPEPTSDVPGMTRLPDGSYAAEIGAGHDPLGVFSCVVEDGKPALRITGEVLGELRSAGVYSNYHLQLEFNWGQRKWPPRLDAPRDSGLMYHVHGPAGADGRTFPRSFELQIMEGDVGDLHAVRAEIDVPCRPLLNGPEPAWIHDPAGTWKTFCLLPGRDGICRKAFNAELPSGAWNTIELVCLHDEALHIVNGRVVMRLRAPRRLDGDAVRPVSAGPIVLQSEAAEIFFRNIRLRPVTAVPDRFVAPR